jgi:ABC-2 type transport system ATP-binding protein
MPLIKVSNVSKQFKRRGKKFYALKEISLNVENGEIFALLGPNGAGKTTLLNILLGMLYPDSGSVTLAGKDVRERSVLAMMGYVSGEERFHWALSPEDILNFGGMMHGLKKQEREKRNAELTELFGLNQILKTRFDSLSTGEKMRLAFAYSLISKPRVLLLDEPTLGLDPDIAIRIRKEIKRINRQYGTTIVLTSHYMKEVEELASHTVFINHGRIMGHGTIREIKKRHPNLEEYFVKMVSVPQDSTGEMHA